MKKLGAMGPAAFDNEWSRKRDAHCLHNLGTYCEEEAAVQHEITLALLPIACRAHQLIWGRRNEKSAATTQDTHSLSNKTG